MSDGNTLSLKQQADFIAALIKAAPRDIDPDTARNWAQNDEALTEVLGRALCRSPETALAEHLLDRDTYPSEPDGWYVEEHQKVDTFRWNAANVALHLDEGQKTKNGIKGYELREALAGKPVLNVNVLDYLLFNPRLIPEEWKGGAIYFWGTVYVGDDGHYVAHLRWHSSRWHWTACPLYQRWYDNDPAAVLAS